VAALAGLATAQGCADDDPAPVCETQAAYFANNVWPVISKKCSSCHSPDGLARESSYVLKNAAEAGFLDHNRGVLADLALTEKSGKSVLLLKPTNQTDHKGGPVIAEGSHEYNVLQGFVDKTKSGDDCVGQEAEPFANIELLDENETLRKAAIVIAGRLPTLEEIDRVKAGGFPELDVVLTEMMSEEAFYDYVKRIYNDYFTTDFYLQNNASGQLSGNYANPNWIEDDPTLAAEMMAKYSIEDENELERYTNWGIAREPLELIAHVLREKRAFSEVLTADYMMVTPLSAISYGVTADFKGEDPLEFAEAKIPDLPHAGFLTSPMFLSRHTTTDTNRNRHRALVTIKAFLGTDILKTAEQAVDQSLVTDFNPTRNNAACTVCHARIDPIAGTFQAWTADGAHDPGFQWFQEMWEPGFGTAKLPENEYSSGSQWLAKQIVTDPGFALAGVFMMYEGLTGRERLVAPVDFDDPNYSAEFDGFLMQADQLGGIATQFADSDYDLRVAVKALIMSPYFRAKNSSVELSEYGELKLGHVGLGLLLTPEQLDRKIEVVLGTPWNDGQSDPYLNVAVNDPSSEGDYQLFYGGHDSDSTISRVREPSGLLASVADRMAIEMSCRAVPSDFARDVSDRVLFPAVEVNGQLYDPVSLMPETDDGIPVQPVVTAIKSNIVALHARVLGEQLEPSDPEIEHTYDVFYQAWKDGYARIGQGGEEGLSADLPNPCRISVDPDSGEDLPDGEQIVGDEEFVIRAWMATTTYLLSDYRFLYE